MAYLDIKQLAYGTPDGRPLIRGLDFSLDESEILLIKGPNGIGKTTLLEILAGHGRPLSGKMQWSIKKAQIFYLPQLHNREFHISLTLLDVLKFAGRFSDAMLAESSKGLLTTSQLSLSWNTASGGERQKTLLTRAFIKNPQVLILDEPMNHLDLESRASFQALVQSFVKREKRSVVMVGHQAEDAWVGAKVVDLTKARV